MIKYLDEIETEFENILVCLSGAQMGLNHEKVEVRISWHIQFKRYIISPNSGTKFWLKLKIYKRHIVKKVHLIWTPETLGILLSPGIFSSPPPLLNT